MRRTASIFGLAFWLVACATPSIAKPVRLAFVYSDGNMVGTTKAVKALLTERPDLRGQVSITFLTESVFDDAKPDSLTGVDVLVLDIMNQQMLDRFNAAHKVDLIASVRGHGKVVAVGEGLLPKENYLTQGCIWDERPRAYWAHGGPSNQIGLVKYVLEQAGVRGLSLPEPQPSLDFGYYYPGGGTGQMFATWEQFDAWRQAHGKTKPGAARVAVGFYKSTYYTGDSELLDAIIAEIERHGAEAIPMFGYPGAVATERLLIDPHGTRRADVGLSFLFNFADAEAWKSLVQVDVPVINLVSLYG